MLGRKTYEPEELAHAKKEFLMNNDGVIRGNNVIKYIPEGSVLKLEVGDHIVPTAADFERRLRAGIETRYLLERNL
jgi:hypothetical protein